MNRCLQGIHCCFLHFCRVAFASEPQDEGDGNKLIVELEEKDEKRERETNMWFSKVWIAHLDLNKQNRFTVDFNVFFTLRRKSLPSWIWTTTPTPWANCNKPSCCRPEKAKRGKWKRRRSLPCRNRKWSRPHRKWRRMKTTATLMMTTAAMMKGETYIFLLILMLLYLILFAIKGFFPDREIAQMKQASAAVGASGALDDDDFQVVSVEKISQLRIVFNIQCHLKIVSLLID